MTRGSDFDVVVASQTVESGDFLFLYFYSSHLGGDNNWHKCS